jgi:ATP-dependent helicase/nuclease subunit A
MNINDLIASDQKSRIEINSNFKQNIFVEAGAGSGKTTAMVGRIIEALRRGLTTIDRIVAITFTNEGAASLRSKIQTELQRAINEENEGTSKKHLSNALNNLSLSTISTIHSFSLDILKLRPVEAGIDPEMEIESQEIEDAPFEDIWNTFLLELNEKSDKNLKQVIENEGIDLELVKEMSKLKVKFPDLELHSEKVSPLVEEDINRTFIDLSEKILKLKELHQSLVANDLGSNVGKRRNQYLRKVFESYDYATNFSLKENFILKFTGSNEFTVNKLQEVDTLIDTIVDSCNKFKSKYYDYLHSILAPLIIDFQKFHSSYKKLSSKIGFDDILFFCRELLRTNQDVRRYFKSQFSYIFIDETQDTDPLQTEIVFFLSEEINNFASSWREVKLVPGKLFMVGDPKQSIYRFRRADIQMYEEAKQIIIKQNGKLLELTKNFRSSPKILEFVNKHFFGSFINLDIEIKQKIHPEFRPLLPGAVYATEWEFPVAVNPIESEEGAYEEAKRTCSYINSIVGKEKYLTYDEDLKGFRQLKYSDITILFSKVKHIGVYVSALERSGMQTYEVGEKLFFTNEEIRSVIYALNTIDSVNDKISLYGTLKSLFGFSDRELFDHMKKSGNFSLFSSNSDCEVSKALSQIVEWQNEKSSSTPSQIVKKIADSTGIAHIPMQLSSGLQTSAKIFRLIEMLIELEADASLSFSEIIRKLNASMKSGDTRLSSISLSKNAENAVRIMTVHKAKGLESPVVILADSTIEEPKDDGEYCILRESSKIIIPYNKGGFYNLDAKTLLAFEEAKQKSETERLRYVAATRAKDLLMICAKKVKKVYFTKPFLNTLMSNVSGDKPTYDSIPAYPVVTLTDFYEIEDTDTEKEFIDASLLYADAIKRRDEKLEVSIRDLNSLKPFFKNVHDIMKIDTNVYRKGGRVSRGKAFGSMIHKLMELHVKQGNFNLENIIDRLMGEYEVSPKYREDARTVFNKLILNQHVVEAKKSPEKYCEWEFIRKLDDGTFLTGTIDLIYKTVDGSWIILDYKTDDLADENYKKQIEPNYKNQLELYKQSFEESTGFRISHCLLIYPD